MDASVYFIFQWWSILVTSKYPIVHRGLIASSQPSHSKPLLRVVSFNCCGYNEMSWLLAQVEAREGAKRARAEVRKTEREERRTSKAARKSRGDKAASVPGAAPSERQVLRMHKMGSGPHLWSVWTPSV
jgi:hypothetical protein